MKQSYKRVTSSLSFPLEIHSNPSFLAQPYPSSIHKHTMVPNEPITIDDTSDDFDAVEDNQAINEVRIIHVLASWSCG